MAASELKYVFDERSIPVDLQTRIIDAGYISTNLFAAYAETRSELRENLIADFPLDTKVEGLSSAECRERRLNCARLVDAWDVCKRRCDEVVRRQAEQRASRAPITLPKGSLLEMRRAYEEKFEPVDDKVWPSSDLLERRFEEIEENAVQAEPLSSVVPVSDAPSDQLDAVVDSTGALRVKRTSHKLPLPGNSEQLRTRLRTLALSFQVARARHPTRAWLATTSESVWRSHVDYVLGDRVFGFEHEYSGMSFRPEWSTVLRYELEIRKLALYKVMLQGIDLAAALLLARQCSETRERYFTTQVALSAVARATKRSIPQAADPKKAPRKGAKGSKGKGKSQPSRPFHKHALTADKKKICFSYNSVAGCTRQGCQFAHVCTSCLGSHPLPQCGVANSSS
eukprot:6487712-Amphidinium_carterae.1